MSTAEVSKFVNWATTDCTKAIIIVTERDQDVKTAALIRRADGTTFYRLETAPKSTTLKRLHLLPTPKDGPKRAAEMLKALKKGD